MTAWPAATRQTSCWSAHRPHADRPRHAHRELELLRRPVARARPVHDDGQLRPPRVLELPDQQLARLRRRPPVHVPPVVTRDVVAQRVEGQIAGGQITGGLPFQVTLESGAERVKRDDLRVHEQLNRRLLDGVPPEQAERVGAHRARRADRDDRAPVGRHHEQLVVAGAGAERRDRERRVALADRDLDGQRAQPRPGPVGGDNASRGRRPDADPRRVKLDGDVKARPPDHEADRDEQRDEAARRHEEQLLPAESHAGEPRGHGDEDRGPSRGGGQLPRRPQRWHEVVAG